MSNPWKTVAAPKVVNNLSDIMSEQYASGLQMKYGEFEEYRTKKSADIESKEIPPETVKETEESDNKEVCESDDVIAKVLQCQFDKEYDDEIKRYKKRSGESKVSVMKYGEFEESLFEEYRTKKSADTESKEIPTETVKETEESDNKEVCESDDVIAKVLQCQFDKEYDDEIKRIDKKRSGESKVSVSLNNYRHIPEHLVYDSDSEEDIEVAEKKDWDHFETNEKEYASLHKRGYSLIKENSRHHLARKNKMFDRKESQATAEMGVDEATRLVLFKLINNGLLEDINGIISTGKESVVLHAFGDTSYPDIAIPKECAIKVFKTTLNEFKTRDKYIQADYRFKDRFSKQNPRKIVHMWAEKEMHNMNRLHKIGLNCPDVVILKKHVLVMSFIGKDNKPAPKLRDVILEPQQWQSVYSEVVESMHKMYNVGQLIHADLSEYNILWWENKCWFIDVSQSVQPNHPHGLQFLLRDCNNISTFFKKKGVSSVKSGEDLFKSITGFDEIDVNMLEGVHTIYNSLSTRFEIDPDDNRVVSYPFEYCWQKTNEEKKGKSEEANDELEDEFEEMWINSLKGKVDKATNFANEVYIDPNKPLSTIVEKVDFGNELTIDTPKDDGSTGVDKKS